MERTFLASAPALSPWELQQPTLPRYISDQGQIPVLLCNGHVQPSAIHRLLLFMHTATRPAVFW